MSAQLFRRGARVRYLDGPPLVVLNPEPNDMNGILVGYWKQGPDGQAPSVARLPQDLLVLESVWLDPSPGPFPPLQQVPGRVKKPAPENIWIGAGPDQRFG